jgi:CheY-like chemotaxis protein
MTERLTKGQLYARLKCLIVDDNKTVRGCLKSILQSFGVKPDSIQEANNMTVAYRCIEMEQKLDVVFCDILLGDGVGMDVLRYARDKCGERSPAFIFISSDVSKDHLSDFLELGVRDVLLKPLTPHSIEASLNRQLPKLIAKALASNKDMTC